MATSDPGMFVEFNGPGNVEGLPNPVSASAMTGRCVCCTNISEIFANSVCVITERSGSPMKDPVPPLPARYRKSKPTFDARCVDTLSKTPGPMRHFPREINQLKSCLL